MNNDTIPAQINGTINAEPQYSEAWKWCLNNAKPQANGLKPYPCKCEMCGSKRIEYALFLSCPFHNSEGFILLPCDNHSVRDKRKFWLMNNEGLSEAQAERELNKEARFRI